MFNIFNFEIALWPTSQLRLWTPAPTAGSEDRLHRDALSPKIRSGVVRRARPELRSRARE
jgi:hypothetical protein